MKIVNIILTSQNGGAEQVFLDYMKVLKNLGHKIFAVIKSDAPYAEKTAKLCISVRKTSNRFGFYDFIAVRNIANYLQEFDADIVFAHTGRASCLVKKAIKKIKNKKIFLIAINHSMNVKRSIGADLILSVNKEIFYKTIDFGQDEAKSFVMHNATECEGLTDIVPQVNFQEKSEIILGVIGRFDKIKSFEFAIRAIKKLKKLSEEEKLNKKFLLKIAGSGPEESFLRNLVKELGIEEEVQFLKWIEDKKSFFDSIDIFCLTSKRETFGLVLLEAMKFCKPIISTAADGPKEIIRNEIDGLLVELEPLANVGIRLTEAIMKMVTEPELANKMVENSFVRVKEKFSYEMLQKKIAEIVGKI
jgi:glycosyltransferase involved in cell wall biosynthesis